MSAEMQKSLLLKSQRAQVAKILEEYQLPPRDFDWKEVSSEHLENTKVQALHHIQSGYAFNFDKAVTFNNKMYWACTFSPGNETPQTAETAQSWDSLIHIFQQWTSYLKREIDAEDPWSEAGEDFTKAWSGSNEKFKTEELVEIDLRLDQIQNYLVNQSDHTQESLASIASGIAEIKASARKLGRKDWALMFIGWFVTNCANWAISQIYWHEVARILLQGAHTFLLSK
jgi:hypothetical protein